MIFNRCWRSYLMLSSGLLCDWQVVMLLGFHGIGSRIFLMCSSRIWEKLGSNENSFLDFSVNPQLTPQGIVEPSNQNSFKFKCFGSMLKSLKTKCMSYFVEVTTHRNELTNGTNYEKGCMSSSCVYLMYSTHPTPKKGSGYIPK